LKRLIETEATVIIATTYTGARENINIDQGITVRLYYQLRREVSHIQFGDCTFIQSSYTNLGKPITEPEKKIAPPFTTSQNQAYVFYTQSPILTDRQLVLNNQSLDYLDNSNLGAIEFQSLYH
jgi:hypothetical protein